MQGPPQSNIGNLFNDGQFYDTSDGLRVTELSPSSPLPDGVEVIHGTVEEPEGGDDDNDMHVGLSAVRGSRVRKLIMVSRRPLVLTNAYSSWRRTSTRISSTSCGTFFSS